MVFDRSVDLSTIRVQDVGATCIMLVSKFSRIIYANHKVVIRLHHAHVLNTVYAYAKLIDDEDLKLVYKNIEREIYAYLASKYPPKQGNIGFRFNKKVALQSNNHFRNAR